MGLNIEVGLLAQLDPAGREFYRDELARLNQQLISVGLKPHLEPENCEAFSSDLYSYSGIHYLRRIAAHLDIYSTLPPPGKGDASDDPAIEEYYARAQEECPEVSTSISNNQGKRTFDHLIFHSDTSGYYIPQDFSSVLILPDSTEEEVNMLGSSFRLKEECQRLAASIELPLDLDPEAEIVVGATEVQGEGETLWQRYGIESYVCLRLYTAAKLSLKTGAAIVFH